MSWKSLVSAGLLCVVASPALAAPSLTVTRSYSQPQGAIIWEVVVNQVDSAEALGIEFPATLAGYAATPDTAPFLRDSAGDPHNGAAGNSWYYNETAAGSGILLWNTQLAAGDTEQNVGANPFTGTDTEGLYIDTALRQLFAALGSDENLTDADVGAAGKQVRTLRIATSDGILSWNNVKIAEEAVGLTTISGSLGSIVARGDMNGNGVRNFQDATPFGTALTNAALYQTQFPGLDRAARGDMNGNGLFNFQDATPFGNCLITPGTCLAPPTSGAGSGGLASGGSVVPEPASIGLVALGLMAALGIRRRK